MNGPSPLSVPKVERVVARLHARDRRQFRRAIPHFLGAYVRTKLIGRPYRVDDDFMRDKLVALDPAKCALAYALCRALRATRVIGTSFGVSTIYLAAGVRDNAGGGVYGTEHEPSKAAVSRAHLAEAGVADYVHILDGDVRKTLRDVKAPIDLALIDICIPVALQALEQFRPKLRADATVLCDNIEQFAREYADYLAYVRAPEHGFRTTTIPGNGGLEVSAVVAP